MFADDLASYGAVGARRVLNQDNDQLIVIFGNGYRASVIIGEYSYGGREGLFEVAVLDANGELDYSTPVTDDVIGRLDREGVVAVFRRIAELPTCPGSMV